MTGSSTPDDLVDALAEEFLQRLRVGDQPSIAEYCQRCPERAEEIGDLLATILRMEDVPASTNKPGSGIPRKFDREEIGGYRIIELIGRGGMGMVFEAEHIALGRRVALKVLPHHVSQSRATAQRFEREARAAAKMHHTNIVPVFDVGQDDDFFFYAMQLIDGPSLDLVIGQLKDMDSESRGKLLGHIHPPRDDNPRRPLSSCDSNSSTRRRNDLYHSIAWIGYQTAQALAYSHARGVIHRDVKPANLILDSDQVVWVTDFGLAKTDDEGLTQTGDFLGTLRFMAPERFTGQCDARADIYALG